MKLKEEQLNKIEGGAFKISSTKWTAIGGGGLAFVIGFISGFLRPSACKSGK